MPLYLKIIIGYLIVSYVINIILYVRCFFTKEDPIRFEWSEFGIVMLAPVTVYVFLLFTYTELHNKWREKHPYKRNKRTYPEGKGVSFRNLPFEPTQRQLLFIDSGHDDKIRTWALENYDKLCYWFHTIDIEFIYIDAESSSKYMLPRCGKDFQQQGEHSDVPIRCDILKSYMVHPEYWSYLSNSFMYYMMDEDGNQIFNYCFLPEYLPDPESMFVTIIDGTNKHFNKPKDPDILYCTKLSPEEELEEQVKLEKEKAEFLASAERLQVRGVTQLLLHKWLTELTPVSRMSITEDYRIFLPDYDNQEIVMNNLPKALYFLFLRYPEGLYIKTLQDHYTELYNIYAQLNPTGKEDKMRLSITEITNPLSNRAHENISRANKAFKDALSEYTAQPYLIDGTKGELYSIKLDREKIDWNEE